MHRLESPPRRLDVAPFGHGNGRGGVRAGRREQPRSACLVLVIEDETELAQSLREMLEELGFRGACVANGREALEFLETRTPSLLLVDLFMPIMGGIEFLHTLKDIPRLSEIPKIIMTAANDHMVGVKEDATVLYKPLDFDALRDLVRHHCDRVRDSSSRRCDSHGAD
jgi:CheY-like chemotaxis protein